MTTLQTEPALNGEFGSVGAPAIPRPKSLTEIVLDIQMAQEAVAACEADVAEAARRLADANGALADAILSAAPLRKLFGADKTPNPARASAGKATGNLPKGSGFVAWARDHTIIGETFKIPELGRRFAASKGVDFTSGMAGGLWNNKAYKKISKGTFKRVA